MIKSFNLIAACDSENGIGQNGDLPWILSREYEYFRFITQRTDEDLSFFDKYRTGDHLNGLKVASKCDQLPTEIKNENLELCPQDEISEIELKCEQNENDATNLQKAIKSNQSILLSRVDQVSQTIEKQVFEPDKLYNCLIMGRATWQSINCRPLENRLNLVLSRQCDSKKLQIDDEFLFSSLEDALVFASNQKFIKEIFVVGGEQVYAKAIQMNECKKIYLTRIRYQFDCDRFFPPIDKYQFNEIDEFNLKGRVQFENDLYYEFHIYQRAIDAVK